MYIRINHLTINEEVEVWELCEEDGTVADFGTEEEMSAKLEIEEGRAALRDLAECIRILLRGRSDLEVSNCH